LALLVLSRSMLLVLVFLLNWRGVGTLDSASWLARRVWRCPEEDNLPGGCVVLQVVFRQPAWPGALPLPCSEDALMKIRHCIVVSLLPLLAKPWSRATSWPVHTA
jgi:hypothetical protein